MNIKELDKAYIAGTYARFPVEIISGHGCVAVDETGKEYLDFGSGIAVNTFGIADPEWIAAVTAQLGQVQHTSNLYYTEPCARLARMLCERTGMKKVFFANSGAEANECAIKAARKYAKKVKGHDCAVITLKNSFHGRTVTTLAATGQDVFHRDFTPLTDGFLYAEANNLADMERVIAAQGAENTAAILIEVVQGEGGVIALQPDYVTGLARLAATHDILLMIDEVQTGNGRTGRLYGYQNYGISPDVVTTAKGLGGGLPIGVCMLGEKVQDIFSCGDHGSTFGGNPAVCAGAISVLSRLDDAMLAAVRRKSAHIFDTLTGQPGIRGVSGMGLMIGVETERPASEVVSRCLDRGILVLKAKNKVRLLPPLNIPDELLDRALAGLLEACGGQCEGEKDHA